MAGGRRQKLIVVGMGKLGGGELNVSSDVDLIFVYPEEGDAASLGEFFNRLGRRLIAVLDEATPEGRVFRVDMRLRPWGEDGPLAMSFDALEHYFLTQGREWERYAWIKARSLSGDRPRDPGWSAQGALAAVVRPFVFRKYLDFGAFAAVRELHAQIRAEAARRELSDHVKLGPGGIREIEFIAQAFQLIRGGRDPSLQLRPTLGVLALLAQKGLLPPQAATELTEAYVFLRRLEHRLQYLEDAQTHRLPSGDEDRLLIAQSMGFGAWPAFGAALQSHRERVSRHFEDVFSTRGAPRHALAPLVRKTYSFCKDRERMRQRVVVFQTFYNFARPHMSLRTPLPWSERGPHGAIRPRWRHHTPAMAAGLTDHVWTFRELLTAKFAPLDSQSISG